MHHAATLVSQLVLVDVNHILGLQNGLKLWPDGSQVVGHNQRRGQHRPKRHLRLRLVDAQREVTYDQLQNSSIVTCVCLQIHLYSLMPYQGRSNFRVLHIEQTRPRGRHSDRRCRGHH